MKTSRLLKLPRLLGLNFGKTGNLFINEVELYSFDENNDIVLVDEVLTPDSSRFWNASTYEVGKSQDSYDKQFLRDWLTSNGLNGKEGVKMTDEIVEKTREKYIEAYEQLTGDKWK